MSNHAPWTVRKGIFRSTGQSDFIPTRTPSPIVELPMSPQNNYNSNPISPLSPRCTFIECPLSPPTSTTSDPSTPQIPQTPFIIQQQSSFQSHQHHHPHQSSPLITTSIVREIPIVQEVDEVITHYNHLTNFFKIKSNENLKNSLKNETFQEKHHPLPPPPNLNT